LFLWSLFFYKKNDYSTFTLSNFCAIIKILDNPVIDQYGETAIKNTEQQVNKKLNELKTQFRNDVKIVEELGKELLLLELTPENTYLFIQGHTLFDNVVLMFLKPICSSLIKTTTSNIKLFPENIAELNHYRKKTKKIEDVLSGNTEFKECFLFKKIQQDIDRYIKTI